MPDLFAQDEIAKIVDMVRAAAKAAGKMETKDALFAFFVQQCRENLHCVLAFSAVGDSFRNRLRMFPSLVNCCTIDWFLPWPSDALISVARQFLAKAELGSEDLITAVCNVCMTLHRSVAKSAVKFLDELRRNTYVTPTSYLELINMYTSMLKTERTTNQSKVDRYQNGCDKLVSTNAMVEKLQQARP